MSGSDVEVLTLCVGAFRDKYQAVAMRFDAFSAAWTKFLHSEPNCTSTQDAIETLLRESERELAKLLSTNGNTVPFQGIMVQTLTLHRGQRRDSSTGSSVQSEFAFVAVPGSTLSDTVPEKSVDKEHPVEEAVSEDPSVNKVPVEEAVGEDVDKGPLAEEPISVSEEPVPLCVEPEPVSQECETFSFDWGFRRISKMDKKKKKATFAFGETQPAEEYPTEEYPTEVPAEEPLAEEVCCAYDIIEEVPVCHPELDAPRMILEGGRLPLLRRTRRKRAESRSKLHFHRNL